MENDAAKISFAITDTVKLLKAAGQAEHELTVQTFVDAAARIHKFTATKPFLVLRDVINEGVLADAGIQHASRCSCSSEIVMMLQIAYLNYYMGPVQYVCRYGMVWVSGVSVICRTCVDRHCFA